MNQQVVLERISTLLSRFAEEVKIVNSNGEFSINIHAENVLLKILNVAYDIELENVNYEEGKTFPAIDLRDASNRIAFQVSSTGTVKKVIKTLKEFAKYNLDDNYDKLYFYFLKGMGNRVAIDNPRIIKELGNLNADSVYFLDHAEFYKELNRKNNMKKIIQICQLLEEQFADLYVSASDFIYNLDPPSKNKSIISPIGGSFYDEQIKDFVMKMVELTDNKQITDQRIYELLINIDKGHIATEVEKQILARLESITWNNITSLPKCLGMLKSLKSLNLRDNIINDIRSLAELKSLTTLDLSRTQVDDISALSCLTGLRQLNLQGSRLTSIPECILDLDLCFICEECSDVDWTVNSGIYIHELRLTNQPVDIFSLSKDLIRAYYKNEDQFPVNEYKVVFLGDADSGKTFSINRLLCDGAYLKDDEIDLHPKIQIIQSRKRLESHGIAVNYWDFGDDEIDYSMHHLFMTEQTAYVVFLDARQDSFMDMRALNWLKCINTFAPKAPVLVVVNKMDQNNYPKSFGNDSLGAYANQVKGIVWLSARDDEPQEFLKKLQGSINSILMELPGVTSTIPKSWKYLMESIRRMQAHYITNNDFKKKCSAFSIINHKETHKRILELLKVIGIGFCYYEERSIANYILLNPKWIANALYTIVINGRSIWPNGIIMQNDLYDLLEETTIDGVSIERKIPELAYDDNDVNYILGVTRRFELSYRIAEGVEFFPILCDADEKVSLEEVPNNSIHFIFEYEYLPKNVLHRLIVDMRRDLDYQCVWYSGAVFNNTLQNQTAYIHSMGNDLHIYVYGEDNNYSLNEYLTPISNLVRKINKELGISAEEYLTCSNNNTEARISLKTVMGNLRIGIRNGYNDKLGKVIQYDKIAHRYFNEYPHKDDELLQNIIKALQNMQKDKNYYRTQENSTGLKDSRNRYVSEQLKLAYYNSDDKQTEGISSTGSGSGKRDIVIKGVNGSDYLIYEGLNLKNFNKTNIDKHIQKLLSRYNPQGVRQGILATYLECDRDKFRVFTDRYLKHISEYSPDAYHCCGEPKVSWPEGKYLACIDMNYESGDLIFTIHHIIIRMAP